MRVCVGNKVSWVMYLWERNSNVEMTTPAFPRLDFIVVRWTAIDIMNKYLLFPCDIDLDSRYLVFGLLSIISE